MGGAQARLANLPRSPLTRLAARLLAIAWIAAGIIRAAWPTTGDLPYGLTATCHWKVLPAVASVALAIAGATALVTLWTDPDRQVHRGTIAVTIGLVVAWILAAFLGLPAFGRNCAN